MSPFVSSFGRFYGRAIRYRDLSYSTSTDYTVVHEPYKTPQHFINKELLERVIYAALQEKILFAVNEIRTQKAREFLCLCRRKLHKLPL